MFSIKIKVPETIKEELNGRLLFIVDKPNKKKDKQLFNRISLNDGCPFFGVTFYGLMPGDEIDLLEQADHILGWPFKFEEIPHKKLEVQAFFIKYSKYERSDGHTVYGMEDHGGGGNFKENPYNLYSDVLTVNYGKQEVCLTLDKEIELPYELKEGMVTQQGNYEDKENIKYVKIHSKLLSDFWNHDMYFGANVLLPRNYDASKKYPILYWQGHWPKDRVPLRYGHDEESDKEFTEFWDNEALEMIIVSFRDANIFYDDSYHVNSANLGPYGDALVTEAIPYIEEMFGGYKESGARALAGGSTGGWESMALQLFYPKFFGGTWPFCPDGMDFHGFQLIDLYNDDNAYYLSHEWCKVERPAYRDTKGNVIWTVKDENDYELALGGDKAHGQGQWGIWEAVYSPVGEDGYPMNVFDPFTGKINRKVVKYWHDNYDLNVYLKKHHKEIMKDLKGKIHLRGGDMDNFYLNLSQWDITETLEKYKYDGYSVTFKKGGHSSHIASKDLILEIADYFKKQGY